MSKNEKLNRISLYIRIAIVVLCAFFIFARMVNSSLAKYTSKVTSFDQARVATFYVESNYSSSKIEVPFSTSKTTFEFAIRNYVGDKHSEVTYNYGFNITSTNNLPISITVASKDTDALGTLASISGLSGVNGIMLCDGKIEHVYTITIEWNTDVYYEDTKEIDLLTIEYICEQIEPEEVQ